MMSLTIAFCVTKQVSQESQTHPLLSHRILHGVISSRDMVPSLGWFTVSSLFTVGIPQDAHHAHSVDINTAHILQTFSLWVFPD